ncbi:FUSC family protein [Paracoccus sp. WLY502]|uniref:FUSC family protein n=1 Tax=Paracoccus yibinensis TaxID=3068891 RepID=UPI002796B79A|nr:FUSC family protein [Paracoccus sp. WLY502]MDQ1900232.1 FUSC family protein [Paracoccus sp. WLY502]
MLERFIHPSRVDARDMLRRALQSALAGLATYLIMTRLNPAEAFLAILSAVLIIQPSVGGTMGAAWTRLQATVTGSLISLACVTLLPDVWGASAALFLSLLVVGGIAGLRPDWSYGAVAAVSIALAPEAEALGTAGARALAIGLGAALGVFVSLLVWPDRAESRFDRHFRTALLATATRLEDALEAVTQEGADAAPPDHVSDYHKAIQQAQEALGAVKLADCAERQRRLEALRRLYNSIIILDRAAEPDAASATHTSDMEEEVSTLRRQTCALLRALAEGEKGWKQRTHEIDEALKSLRAVLEEDNPRSDQHQNRSALAFGLLQVRKTLSELATLCQRQG